MRSIQIDQEISCSTYKHFEQTNRMLDRYGWDNFIIFDFTKKVEAATIRCILRGGVTINGDEFQFIGCSSSGLKERTCYMFKGSCGDVDHVLEECGSFSSIKSRYKRLKRIGLLFSSATPTRIEVPDDVVAEQADIENDAGNFSDGCGAVCEALANRLRSHCKIRGDYCPSVYQIRYQGCKGVVTIDHNLKGGVQLVVRPSMKKFNPGTRPFRELWLCNHSRPYTFGHLNRQFITLLSSLGVEDDVFLRIQTEHIQRLKNVLHDPEAAFEMLLLDNQPELAYLCTTTGCLKSYRSQLSKLKSKFVSKLEKLQLPVLNSRNVFGVCDPSGLLKYGECYFRYTEQGNCKTLHGRVVVAKNPCYLLGDVRVLTAVTVNGLDHLIDCIVFPIQGKRPHPSEIAGSDLDGDQYFVCWDEGLVVLHDKEPYSYPSEDAPELSDQITLDTLIDYFSSQRNNMGTIDSYYKYWANKKGAGCTECQRLGQLFSRSVDAPKTGDVVHIPCNLKPPLIVDDTAKSLGEESSSSKEHKYVWEKMEEKAKSEKQALSEEIVQSADVETISEEFLWSLLEHKVPNLSDYQLLKLIQHWCCQQTFTEDESQQKLLELTRYINFGEFTVDQQVEAIDTGIPLKIVTNALNKSTLLPQTLLKNFLLDDPHRSWRFYFNSTSAEFNWNHLLRGLQHHPESMVVIKLPDEITFILHFLSPPQLGETDICSGSVIAYFSSGHFNLDLQCVIGSDFKLILNKEMLQLFHWKKTGTFIWLSSEQPSRHHGEQMQNPDTLFDRISVDLTRFKRDVLVSSGHPKVNKQSFLTIEMFVKTKNFQPAYMDITEAAVQDDYPVEESMVTEEVDNLPSDPEYDLEDDTTFENLQSCSADDMMAALMQSAQKGWYRGFQQVLERMLTMGVADFPTLLSVLQELLLTMVTKHCHKDLTVEARLCLQTIITSLQHSLSVPLDLLKLLCHAARLGLCSWMEQNIEQILLNICAKKSSDYVTIISKWRLWYFLPPRIAARLSQHLHILYKSLYNEDGGSNGIGVTSVSREENCHIASKQHNDGSLQQYQVDEYVNHFSHLIFDHLLHEIFNADDIRKQACDASSSILRMSCYNHEHPHSATLECDGIEKEEYWRVGFYRTKIINSKHFTVGRYVSINVMIKQDTGCSLSSEVFSTPVAIGCIIEVSTNPANILVEILEPVPLCLKRSAQCRQGHWQLVLIGNVTSFNRSLKALTTLRENPSCTALLPLLVHSRSMMNTKAADNSRTSEPKTTDEPAASTEQFSVQPMSLLNSSQQEAVSAALKQRLTLIHGPPGTGKTHVACEIVQQRLARDKENPLLVVAETNLAVDNLCEKLLGLGIRVVRIGRLEHISPALRGISLEGQIEKKRIHEGRDKQKSTFPNKKVTMSILNAAQVVATTCSGAGDPNVRGRNFPFVIIDEATQVTEPTSLIPLVYCCQQLTLIGDPEQLTPTLPVAQKPLDSYSELMDVSELSVSLFHRLQKLLPSTFLAEQHRMHPELAVFPSRKFYGGRLLTASCRHQQQSVFQEEIPVLDTCKPIVFVTVSEREKRIGTTFCNPAEAKALASVVKYLINRKVSLQQIAILTPYLGQLKCIQEECQSEKIYPVKPHTIDSFQGREADVVIFSTVRCNTYGELGFTNDKRRINVLLTRARHGLIGIGCEKTLSAGSEIWKEWLENVKVIDGTDQFHYREEKHPGRGRRGSHGSHRGPRHGAHVHHNFSSHGTRGQSQDGGHHRGFVARNTQPHSAAGSSRGRWHNGSNRSSDDRPRSSGGFHSQGITEDEGQAIKQNQRGGYQTRGRRGRGSSYYRGRRRDVMDAGAHVQQWSPDRCNHTSKGKQQN